MSGNQAGRHADRFSDAALWGATILLLVGLPAIALGAYLWAFEAARPPSPSSGGISFAGLGYALAIVLIAFGSVPACAGGWILVRPRPLPLGIGATVGAGYALVLLWMWVPGGQGRLPFDPNAALPLGIATLLAVAAVLLAYALVNAPPPPVESSRGQGRSAKRRRERWQDDSRVQKPPPGYSTRRH